MLGELADFFVFGAAYLRDNELKFESQRFYFIFYSQIQMASYK